MSNTTSPITALSKVKDLRHLVNALYNDINTDGLTRFVANDSGVLFKNADDPTKTLALDLSAMDSGTAAILSVNSAGELVSTPNPATGIKSIASVADLATQAATEDGIMIHVVSFYSGIDGGGGVFRWSAADTRTAVDGMIVEGSSTIAGVGRWVRVCDAGNVSVTWFGAQHYYDAAHLEDDVGFDSQPAIVAATAWIASAVYNPNTNRLHNKRGGIIRFPAGAYKVLSGIVLPANIAYKIIGDGFASSIYSRSAPSAAFYIFTGQGSPDEVVFEDIAISGPQITGGGAVNGYGNWGANFNHCYLTGYYGLNASGATAVYIRRCQIELCARAGIYKVESQASRDTAPPAIVWIENCLLFGNRFPNGFTYTQFGVWLEGVQEVMVSNTVFNGCIQSGIKAIGCRHIEIDNSVLEQFVGGSRYPSTFVATHSNLLQITGSSHATVDNTSFIGSREAAIEAVESVVSIGGGCKFRNNGHGIGCSDDVTAAAPGHNDNYDGCDIKSFNSIITVAPGAQFEGRPISIERNPFDGGGTVTLTRQACPIVLLGIAPAAAPVLETDNHFGATPYTALDRHCKAIGAHFSGHTGPLVYAEDVGSLGNSPGGVTLIGNTVWKDDTIASTGLAELLQVGFVFVGASMGRGVVIADNILTRGLSSTLPIYYNAYYTPALSVHDNNVDTTLVASGSNIPILSEANSRSLANWTSFYPTSGVLGTLVAGNEAAPVGQAGLADAVTDSSNTLFGSRVIVSNVTAVVGDVYRVSGWVSANGAGWPYFGLSSGADTTRASFIELNPATGAYAVLNSGGWSISRVVVGDVDARGWRFVQFDVLIGTSAGAYPLAIGIFPTAGSTYNAFSVAATGTRSFFGWNAVKL